MKVLRYVDGQNPATAAQSVGLESCWVKETHAPMSREAAESLAAIATPPGEGVKAIPVAPDGAFRLRKRTVTVTVDETGEVDLLEVARQAVPGSVVTAVELLEDRKRTKLERKRAKKRTVRWHIHDENGDRISGARGWTTATAACKAAEEGVKDGDHELLHVRGSVSGEGFARNYATYRRVQTSRRVKLRITVEETLRKDPAPIGWLFFA